MGLQGAQANDQDQLQTAQLRANDVPIQTTAHLYQERRHTESLGEIDQLDSRLYIHIEECNILCT